MAFVPDKPQNDIRRLVYKADCEDYWHFEDIFRRDPKQWAEDCKRNAPGAYPSSNPTKDFKQAWACFLDMIIRLEEEIHKGSEKKTAKGRTHDYQLDLMGLHKCFVQGPQRERDGSKIPFGGPGLPMKDFFAVTYMFGIAQPAKTAGFHSSSVPLVASYRGALETLNDEQHMLIYKAWEPSLLPALIALRVPIHLRWRGNHIETIRI
jgi:hypothetical protein